MGGGVHHHAEPVGTHVVNDQVVDDAGLLIQHAAVQCLAGLRELGHVVGQELLQELPHPRAFQVQHGHVRDVEHAGVAAHRVVLVDLRTVMHRHVPTAEIHHAGASGQVRIV